MNTKDVLKIIKQAKKAGLESIELEGLKLRFFPGDAEERVDLRTERPKPLEQQLESTDEEKIDDIEDQLAFLAIDDPVRYEQMIVGREIELGADEQRANDWGTG